MVIFLVWRKSGEILASVTTKFPLGQIFGLIEGGEEKKEEKLRGRLLGYADVW